MTATLPATLRTYFAATNRHDVNAMVAVFADSAVVKDESVTHQGRVAIRRWMDDTISRYDVRVEPTAVAEHGGTTVVTGLVSGTFPGSPVELRHAFTLDGDRIVRLEIG